MSSSGSSGRPGRQDPVVHLEVGPVVLGKDDVDVLGRDGQGALELGDDGEGELAVLVGGAAAAEVGVEEGRAAGGVGAAEGQVFVGEAAETDRDVVGARV